MMQRCTACPYLPFNFHTRKQTHFDDLWEPKNAIYDFR